MYSTRTTRLKSLLRAAKQNLQIRHRSDGALLHAGFYHRCLKEHWTTSTQWTSILVDYAPHITNETTRLELEHFLKEELAPFIHDDGAIVPAGQFVFDGESCGLRQLIEQLLRIAIVRRTTGGVRAVEACTTAKHASFQLIALLEGVQLSSAIQIWDGVKLAPLRRPTPDASHNFSSHSLTPLEVDLHSERAQALLITDFVVSPALKRRVLSPMVRDSGEECGESFRLAVAGKGGPDPYGVDLSEECFCQALSLASDSAVQVALKWKSMAEDDLLNLSGVGHKRLMVRPGPFGDTVPVTEAEVEEAKRLYAILTNLDSKTKKRLQVPIDRWINSKVRSELTDKMIDLSIALEALYLSETGMKTELAFRLRLRAAWFLGNDQDARREIMDVLRTIYKYRSAAVHTGKLDSGDVKMGTDIVSMSAFVERGQTLCRDSIVRVLRDGSFPDWDRLILGATPAPPTS